MTPTVVYNIFTNYLLDVARAAIRLLTMAASRD